MKTIIAGWLLGVGIALGMLTVLGWLLFFMKVGGTSILKGVWL